MIIERGLTAGLTLEKIRRDEAVFQAKVIEQKLAWERSALKDKTLFFDRGIPECLAYYRLCGLDTKKLARASRKGTYRAIFFNAQLPFQKDYARIEDETTAIYLARLIRESYEECGYPIIDVPVASVEKRVRIVLDAIGRIGR